MKRFLSIIVALAGMLLLLAACQPETVEVTRVITETVTEQIEVTRIVEGEVQTETIEVTRIIEVEAEPEAAPETTRLRIAIVGDESTLHPYTYVTGYPGWNLLLLQYDTLYQLDGDGVPQPWLATAAEVSDDGLTVTIDLRDDVAWHDGEPFTAADVTFSYEYYKEHTEAGRFTRDLRPIASTEVDGDYRVILTLAAPSPSLELGTLADVPIIPEHIWSAVEAPAEHVFESGTNVGTGPFILTEYEADRFYRFVANENYWAGKPAVDELVAIQFADDAGALAAFRSREADMIVDPVSPEQINLMAAMNDVEVLQGPLFTTQMLNYDMERAPFNHAAVRQAISLAVDRQDLIDTVYLGAATPGSAGWIHPASPLFNPAVETLYDPEQAGTLLDEAGITDSDGDGIRELDGQPLSFEFITPGADSLRLRIAELVREMLLVVGIDAQVIAVEQGTWEDAVWPEFDVAQGRDYDMAMWGWSAPVQADPVRLSSLIHSDPAIGSLNLTGYVNEEADALSEELNSATDPDRRAELIGRLQEIIAEEMPFVLLLYPDGAYTFWGDVYDGWQFMTGQGIFHKLSLLPEEARP
ncbi:MAG: ABC transporter substrate-binding protein [Anaerolineae bacterium]|nr:ABC transporter substrate-binding protein [Anaerolineae bacterium]